MNKQPQIAISPRGRTFAAGINYLRVHFRDVTGATVATYHGREDGVDVAETTKTISGTTANLYADQGWVEPAGDNYGVMTMFPKLWNAAGVSNKGLIILCRHRWAAVGGQQTQLIVGNIVNANGGYGLSMYVAGGIVKARVAMQKPSGGSMAQALSDSFGAEASGGDIARTLCGYLDFPAYQCHVGWNGDWGNANSSAVGTGGVDYAPVTAASWSPCLLAGTNGANVASEFLNALSGTNNVSDLLVVEDIGRIYLPEMDSIFAEYHKAPWEVPSAWRA